MVYIIVRGATFLLSHRHTGSVGLSLLRENPGYPLVQVSASPAGILAIAKDWFFGLFYLQCTLEAKVVNPEK